MLVEKDLCARRNARAKNRKRRSGQKAWQLGFETLEVRNLLAGLVSAPVDTDRVAVVPTNSRGAVATTGKLYQDDNFNGRKNGNEPWLSNWLVFNDVNDNDVRDPNEQAVTTGRNGEFRLHGFNANVKAAVPDYSSLDVSDQILVNSTGQSYRGQRTPDVAVNQSGHVVVWATFMQDGSSWGIFGQRFDDAGAKVGSEFQVNSTINSDLRSQPRMTAGLW